MSQQQPTAQDILTSTDAIVLICCSNWGEARSTLTPQNGLVDAYEDNRLLPSRHSLRHQTPHVLWQSSRTRGSLFQCSSMGDPLWNSVCLPGEDLLCGSCCMCVLSVRVDSVRTQCYQCWRTWCDLQCYLWCHFTAELGALQECLHWGNAGNKIMVCGVGFCSLWC